jgi:hypothetical protein
VQENRFIRVPHTYLLLLLLLLLRLLLRLLLLSWRRVC